MQTVSLVLVIFFSAFLALWPAAFLIAAVLHSVARRWRGLRRIALLVPVWSIAASIGLIQFPRLLDVLGTSASQGTAPPSNPSLGSIAAVILALCCAAIAWALLVRSFDGAGARQENVMR